MTLQFGNQWADIIPYNRIDVDKLFVDVGQEGLRRPQYFRFTCPAKYPFPPALKFCPSDEEVLQLRLDRSDILTVVEKRRTIQLDICLSRYSIDNNYL